jgi:prenyl protein peptidase
VAEGWSRALVPQEDGGTTLLYVIPIPFSPVSQTKHLFQGPATEELLFRSMIIPVTLLSHPSLSYLIFVTPLYFGLAHIHHFYEFKLTNPRTPLLPALAVSLFQFGFTSVFGWYAAFLFLRSGSLGAVIMVHSFCNWMGLPRLWGRVGADNIESIGDPRLAANLKIIDQERELHALAPETVMGEGNANGSASGPHSYAHRLDAPLSLKWTVAYYAVLVGGAFAFWKEFWVLTRSEHGLINWEGR